MPSALPSSRRPPDRLVGRAQPADGAPQRATFKDWGWSRQTLAYYGILAQGLSRSVDKVHAAGRER